MSIILVVLVVLIIIGIVFVFIGPWKDVRFLAIVTAIAVLWLMLGSHLNVH